MFYAFEKRNVNLKASYVFVGRKKNAKFPKHCYSVRSLYYSTASSHNHAYTKFSTIITDRHINICLEKVCKEMIQIHTVSIKSISIIVT